MNITNTNNQLIKKQMKNKKINNKADDKILKSIKYMLFIAMLLILNACTTMLENNNTEEKKDIKLLMADKEIDEKNLLDVSIHLFDPGELPKDKEARRGLTEKIRKSEARYMPIHLKYTMQSTGYWASVRVVPDENEASEVTIKGSIIESDGEYIKVNIAVRDSRNIIWFEKNYEQRVSVEEKKETEIEKNDRFQNLYTNIANDIVIYRNKLSHTAVKRIKQIAEIRFASSMSKEAFAKYLKKDKEGILHLKSLPASDDVMLSRVLSIKARNEMLIDTINNYYDVYYGDVWDSYDNWRKFRSEELKTIREIERKAITQKILGVAAIIGAIALGASSNSSVVNSTGVLRTVMVAGGTYALYSGFKTSKESEINKAAIEELGTSFENDVAPVLVEINGKTLKLTGNADQQYNQWRELLKKMYVEETAIVK